ncbi:hypothetical protein L218DRAFT_747565 [Marasmius fiardii PR-910]|nr:hypothetical protein L218DRAFT_747565 [Marasmius fiardii PR-910]
MLVPRAEAPSAEDLRIRDAAFDAIAYLSVMSCTIIIITAVFLSFHPLSKSRTDRVSFRIMIYALCGSVAYSVATILVNKVTNQTACRVAGSFVIVEKYYVWGSLSLAIILGVLTYASNQIVYNPTQSMCYYYDPNPTRGLLWRIGTQLLWSCLTMAGEIITFVLVVVYMFRVKAFSSGPSRETTSTSASTGSQGLSASRQYRKPLGPRQYRNVVLRIALYPLSSLLTTGVTAVGTMISPSQIQSNWIVMSALISTFMFRSTVYALVAAADPGITQGLKVLFRHYVLGETSIQKIFETTLKTNLRTTLGYQNQL